MTQRRFLHSAALPLAAYLLAVSAITLLTVQRNDGHLAYLADDPYIHMAIAKNVALHGVWGVTPDAFTSSSSSPLWVILLASCYAAAGVGTVAPLVLNVAFGLLTLVVLHLIFMRTIPAPWFRGAAILPCILVAVLYTFYGLEHLLQFLLVVLFVHLSARDLAASEDRRWHRWSLPVAFASAATRYENLIPIAIVCLIHLVKGRRLPAVRLGLAASLPVLAHGLYSVANGWYFLPNAVLLKSGLSRATLQQILMGRDPGALGLSLSPAVLFAACLVLLAWLSRRRSPWDDRNWMLVIFLGSALGHAVAARVSGITLARYDAYLIFLGWIAAAGPGFELVRSIIPHDRSHDRIVRTVVGSALVVAAVVGLGLAGRLAFRIARRVTVGCSNIYQQQYQMARFVRSFYQGRTVALNDIGAVSFYSDARVLDLYGLASREVAEQKLRGSYDTREIDRLCRKHDVGVAIAYEDWFTGGQALPSGWVRIGTWRIENNIACRSDTVTFLATDPAKAAAIAANLRAFSGRLPSAVIQAGAHAGS